MKNKIHVLGIIFFFQSIFCAEKNMPNKSFAHYYFKNIELGGLSFKNFFAIGMTLNVATNKGIFIIKKNDPYLKIKIDKDPKQKEFKKRQKKFERGLNKVKSHLKKIQIEFDTFRKAAFDEVRGAADREKSKNR